jgi:hypothetical protein
MVARGAGLVIVGVAGSRVLGDAVEHQLDFDPLGDRRVRVALEPGLDDGCV